jgi:hypothetical protein
MINEVMEAIVLGLFSAVMGVCALVAIRFWAFYQMRKIQDENEAEINELRKKKNEKYPDEYQAAGKSIY